MSETDVYLGIRCAIVSGDRFNQEQITQIFPTREEPSGLWLYLLFAYSFFAAAISFEVILLTWKFAQLLIVEQVNSGPLCSRLAETEMPRMRYPCKRGKNQLCLIWNKVAQIPREGRGETTSTTDTWCTWQCLEAWSWCIWCDRGWWLGRRPRPSSLARYTGRLATTLVRMLEHSIQMSTSDGFQQLDFVSLSSCIFSSFRHKLIVL